MYSLFSPAQALYDIKKMMERSSRYISLSGLSGLGAGFCALVGALVAKGWVAELSSARKMPQVLSSMIYLLETRLILLGLVVLLAAALSAYYFTRRKAKSQKPAIWDHAAKRLLINLSIPMFTGALFIGGLLYHGDGKYAAPASLLFYGLALVNASKYCYEEIRYLGFFEIGLGTAGIYFPDLGFCFWTLGFGFLHIVYGLFIWAKYDGAVKNERLTFTASLNEMRLFLKNIKP
jgi:hypothetical protein